MSNRVLLIQMRSDNDTLIELKIYTTDHSMQYHVSENMRRTFECDIILGSGIKSIENIFLNSTFDKT